MTKPKPPQTEFYSAVGLFLFKPELSISQRASAMGVCMRTLHRWLNQDRLLPWVIADEYAVRLGGDLEEVWPEGPIDLDLRHGKRTRTTVREMLQAHLSAGAREAVEA